MRTINLKPNPAGHAAPITHVAFRPDGKRLASCSYDGTVLVWDTTDPSRPERLAQLPHRRLTNAAAWNPAAPDTLATASADKTVAIWQVPDDGPIRLTTVLARHTDDINSVAWMPDGTRLVCVSEDGKTTLWDTSTGALLAEIGTHAAHCMMVSVSRNGLVATVGEDGMVTVSEPGRPAGTAARHYRTSVEGCAWSHSGTTLAIARDDGAVDLLTPQLDHLTTITVSTTAARTIAWAPDDATLVVGAYDGSLHFFDVTGQRLRRVHDARLWPRSVTAAPGLVAAGSFWSSPHLLDLATAEEIAGPRGPNHGPNTLATVGGELLIGCDSGMVLTVDLNGPPGAPPVRLLPVSDSPVLALAAATGAVYAGTYAGHVVRWGEDRSISEHLGAPVTSLCLTAGLLVAGTYRGELVAFDPATLTVVDRGVPHNGSVKSLSTLHDGFFLSAATDHAVAAGSLHRRVTLWEHGNLVNTVTTLGGQVVASGSRDHTVKVGLLSPAATHRIQVVQQQTLLGPDESVKCVGLLGDPYAPIVLGGSYDFALYRWEVNWSDSTDTLVSGQVVAEFQQGLSCMTRLDGSRIAVAGWDGHLLIVGPERHNAVHLSLDVDELVDRAADHRTAVSR